MLLGERLKYARTRAGLTLAQVNERTEIGVSSLSEFESEKREPSIAQLQRLGGAYNRSVDFFLSDKAVPPKETVLWREKPDENSQEVETAFLKLCAQYNNLENWCNDRVSLDLPIAKKQPGRFYYQDVEILANKVRTQLALGDHPGQMLLKVLEEKCGIKVFHKRFKPTGTAACSVHDDFGFAILLNSHNTRWRRNFDLAHELFHLLTWNLFRQESAQVGTVAGASEEKLATCFARNLLMPQDAMKQAVNSRVKDGKLERILLFDIAREFDVSLEAVIWHLKIMYNLDDKVTDSIFAECKAREVSREDREEDAPMEYPERYRSLAIRALQKGQMSLGRFAEYLGISRREARKFNVEEESCGEIQLTFA